MTATKREVQTRALSLSLVRNLLINFSAPKSKGAPNCLRTRRGARAVRPALDGAEDDRGKEGERDHGHDCQSCRCPHCRSIHDLFDRDWEQWSLRSLLSIEQRSLRCHA